MRGIFVATLFLLLTGACATTSAPARWMDAASQSRGEALLCRVSEDCRDLGLILLDLDEPVAEIREHAQILLSRGMLARIDEDDELAFVLAHEVAHRALGHRSPRGYDERLVLELAADAWAARRLCALGASPEPGRALLARLHDEVERSTAASTARDAALREYRSRIEALPSCHPRQGHRVPADVPG